ncbi:MAG: aspartyl/asparaginyl beta-hydroxylase domain-containing protein [Gammaproteobacteria bacterium]|jgi:hypothetical protein
MNFAGEYLHIGDMEVSQLSAQVESLENHMWQTQFSHTLHDASMAGIHCIPLVWDEQLRHNMPTKLAALQQFAESIRPALVKIADYYETSPKWSEYFKDKQRGYFIRASIEKVCSQVTIPSHRDDEFSMQHAHRIYIPLRTNDDVFFDIGEMTLNLLEGEIVEINNQLSHRIRNDGDQDAVHLILDWVVPGE